MYSSGRRNGATFTRATDKSADTQSLESVYFTDKNGVPLARPVPRKELSIGLSKLVSNLTWSDSSKATEQTTTQQSDVDFEKCVLSFLNSVAPEKSSRLLKERIPGTMNVNSDGVRLLRSADEIRRRQEHIDGRIVQMPVLESDVIGRENSHALGTVHRAILSELRDLHCMISSMESRKFDVNKADVRALFEWFKLFENFIRLYLATSERELYAGATGDAWIQARKAQKIEVVRLVERVEAMKRPMIAQHVHCGQSLRDLHKRVDRMTMRVVRLLKEESERMTMLEVGSVEARVERMIKSLREGRFGREMVVLIAQGARNPMEWMRGVWHDVGRFVIQGWVNRFVERHRGFVTAFERAESEYRELYGVLGKLVDEDIANIRREFV